MKKLITAAVASAFAFLAMGVVNGDDILPSGTSLEGYIGTELKPAYDDIGDTTSNRHWLLVGDDQAELLVTNYESGASYEPRPEQFSGANNNYLKIETSGYLYRSIGVNSQTVDSFPTASIGDGIYLDTLVQFTAAEEEFSTNSLTAGDKIAIEYVEHEGDETTGEAGYTNFVVRAGYVAGSAVVATNYFLTFPGQPANEVQFDKTAWHRLTVRAISNVSKVENANAPVGFAVYVDGTNLVYDVNVAAGDSTYEGNLNSVIQTYLYNSETHALLPSLLRKGETGYDTLSAVAFNGNGCVDDISFTATKPGILPSEGTAVTIAWDANVATYTVVAGETKLIDGEVVSGVGSTNLLLDASVETLTVTATYATGYEAGVWTVTGSGAEISGSTFTIAPGAKLNIVSMYPYFQVGDAFYEEFEGEDGALAAAIAGSGVIKLNADYPHDIALTEGTVTIDLAGKTITGDSLAAIMNGGANLIITNSTVEIGHIVNPAGDSTFAILIGGGTTSIYGGWVDGLIEFDTSDLPQDLLFLYGGYYNDASTTDPASFYRNDCARDVVSYVGDPAYYFQVGSDTPEPPAPIGAYEVIVTPAAKATYSAICTNDNSAVTFNENITTVAVHCAIMITATPAEGYEYAPTPAGWTAGQDGKITKVVDAAGTVEIPEPTAIEYVTLTITSVANCTIVVSNATAEVATGTQFNKADAVQLTVYRTPADGYVLDNCAATETITMDQDQTVTAAVKVSGGYPTYMPDDAAMKAKYDTWAETYGADTGSAYETAFLLNIAPAAADQTLKEASITISGSTVTITANQDLKSVNGKVYIKTAGTLAGLESALWGEATVNSTTGAIEMTSNGTAAFFKIKVDFAANNP